MKLIDGLKLKGKPAEITDCSRDDLPQFFVDMGFKVGAEIGAAKGEFSGKFAKAGLTHYAIDPWRVYSDYYRDHKWDRKMQRYYEQAKKTLSPYPNATIIRKTSMEAVLDFKDDSLDYVYIDGNHLFKYIAEDLSEWTKKVRKGGIVAGHDYAYFKSKSELGLCHVIPVVNAYAQAYNIQNWYIFGQEYFRQVATKDRFIRNWMFLKQ